MATILGSRVYWEKRASLEAHRKEHLMGQEIKKSPATVQNKAPDATAAKDFELLAAKYKAMQSQAYTTQDVAAQTVSAFKSDLDTYITAHVDKGSQDALLTAADKTLGSMEEMTVAQQERSELNNAGWDDSRESLEALFDEIAPPGAAPIYRPKGAEAAAEPQDADVNEVSGDDDEELAQKPTTDASAGGGKPSGISAPSGSVQSAGDQSGIGWGGADLLDPKTSATYKGLSLDALLAKPESLVAQKLGSQPDVIAAIRKVSTETGVPSGLMAAMIVQESNGNRNDVSSENSGYGASVPLDQRRDAGLIQSPLWKFEGANTAEKTKASQDPYTNLRMFADEAKSTYAQTGSWGQVANVWYTGDVAERLDGQAAGGSNEEHYVQNVLGNLGMGGSSYYAGG